MPVILATRSYGIAYYDYLKIVYSLQFSSELIITLVFGSKRWQDY